MPPRVYEFHLKKSHTEEEVKAQVEKNEKEIDGLTKIDELDAGEHTGFTPVETKKEFDWGEVYACASCGEEYPAKAMPFHSWVKHRI